MPSAPASINLEWVRRFSGCSGIGAHVLTDGGALALLTRDQIASRTYLLTALVPGSPDEGPGEVQRAGFSLETVKRVAMIPDANSAYLLTENDIYFVRQEGGVAHRGSLRTRQGDVFLDIQTAGDDDRRSAIVLSQDRAGTSYTVTVLEYPDGATASRVVWNKSWSEPVLAVSISCDGNLIAAAHSNGNIVLMNRQRRILWAYASTDETPVLALAVDRVGNIIAYDAAGTIKRHEAADGGVSWRLGTPPNMSPQYGVLAPALVAIDGEARVVLCAVNQYDHVEDVRAGYVFLNAANGNVIWDDQVASGVTGISISPRGRCAALSEQSGDVMLLSISSRSQPRSAQTIKAGDADVATLITQANRAYSNHSFARTIKILNQVFQQDPSLSSCSSLYDDACWQLKEMVMRDTKAGTPESLAKVEAALQLIPFDERLTIRRNALARLVAESLGREAAESMTEGQYEDAIAKFTEALTIDRSQTEMRNGLRAAIDRLCLHLIKESEAAFQDEKFSEAIEMLERVQELRPGDAAVATRLEQAKGLQAYATGMRHYIGHRYQESAFWFRKTLTLMPDHPEASRYLGYSETFSREQFDPTEAGLPTAVATGPISQRFGMLE